MWRNPHSGPTLSPTAVHRGLAPGLIRDVTILACLAITSGQQFVVSRINQNVHHMGSCQTGIWATISCRTRQCMDHVPGAARTQDIGQQCKPQERSSSRYRREHCWGSEISTMCIVVCRQSCSDQTSNYAGTNWDNCATIGF